MIGYAKLSLKTYFTDFVLKTLFKYIYIKLVLDGAFLFGAFKCVSRYRWGIPKCAQYLVTHLST